MRIYENHDQEKIFTVICNKCKKVINVENNIIKEGLYEVEYQFGYFSHKDGEIHSFDLCEDCYDEITNSFLIPPEISKAVEVL
ncbi:MAG: hypothetical protein FWC09_05850 [Lachnospiraceae bacterium]|nr:hypothetical protein [Lachnospiraceae bacterium]